MPYFDFFDDFDFDDDFLSGGYQCRGITKKGLQCKINLESPYCAETIAQYGFCTKHMAQRHNKVTNPGFYETRHDIYERDKPHPAIVTAARNGDLAEVQRLLDRNEADPCNKKNERKNGTGDRRHGALVNACRNRKEVEEKHGYDKEWNWDDDTPLIAAVRGGHVDVVLELLIRGADTMCKSCPSDDVHETAFDVAEKRHVLGGSAILEMLRIATDNADVLEPKKPVAVAVGGRAKPQKKTDLNSMTVEELKIYLRKYGLRVSGRKAELVQRLAGYPVLEDHYKTEMMLWEATQGGGSHAAGNESIDEGLRQEVIARLRAAAQLTRAAPRGTANALYGGEGAYGGSANMTSFSSSSASAGLLEGFDSRASPSRVPAAPSTMGLMTVSNKRLAPVPPPTNYAAFGGTRKQTLPSSLPHPAAKRARTDSLKCSGCSRVFVNSTALSQHLADNKRCPAAVAHRKRR